MGYEGDMSYAANSPHTNVVLPKRMGFEAFEGLYRYGLAFLNHLWSLETDGMVGGSREMG